MHRQEPSSVLIEGGRIIDPDSGVDERAGLLVEHGRIGRVVRQGEAPAVAEMHIDATGLVVVPGFIDVHTHLRYPGQSAKETIASGTAAAIHGGFTSVCAMANTNPPVDSAELIEQVRETAEAEARCRVYCFGAASRGLQGREPADAADLVRAGAVGLSDDGRPIASQEVMASALGASEKLGVPVSAHEEAPDIVRDGVVDGQCAGRYGLPPWPCVGEVEMIRRDISLLERHGGRLHIAHVSCAASVPLIAEARSRGLPITAEVTPHHLLMTEDLLAGNAHLPRLDTRTKVNPPLRSRHDTSVLQQALRDGIIDVVATDHAPHTCADKATSYDKAPFGLTGLELALSMMLTLVRAGVLSLPEAIGPLTSGPAAAFNLPGGTLRKGSPADITMFDADAIWHAERDTLITKGKNTPLMESEMRGRVRHCIVGGDVHTFEADHVLRATDSP